MAEETAVEEEVKPAGNGTVMKMVMIVVLALLSSVAGGFISFLLISRTLNKEAKGGAHGKEAAEQEKIAETLQKSAVLPLEPFVVNLADSDAARYLRIKISLMVDDKAKLKELSENLALQMKVRDVILQSLTAKTSHELINEEGKNKLRQEIHEKIGVYFQEPKLVDVMFTEFVIQL